MDRPWSASHPSMRWTTAMDMNMCAKLLEITISGGRMSDGGFNRIAHAEVAAGIKKDLRIEVTTEHVRGRMKTLKKTTNKIEELCLRPEFEFDLLECKIKGSEEAWDELLQPPNHIYWSGLKNKSFPSHTMCTHIFGPMPPPML